MGGRRLVSDEGPAGARARIRTVVGCFLAQNLAMGVAFGSFGPLLAANQNHFGVNRATAALGMSVVTLTLGLLSPVAGRLLERLRMRDAMAGGALLSAAAYLGLAWTPSYGVALLCYVLVGIGVCVTGIIGPLVLVSRWVEHGRGKVLSLVNLPLVLFASPYLIAIILPFIGRAGVLSVLAGLFLLLAPVLVSLIRERPGKMATSGSPANAAASEAFPPPALFRSPAFWLLSLGIGIMAGTGVVYVVHLVPFGLSKGMTLAAASGMLSIYAGAGLVGTPLFGWIIDKIGPAGALVVAAAGLSLLSIAVTRVEGVALFVVAALLGICCTPIPTLHGAALSALFGERVVARAVGYSYFVKLPFLVGSAPAIGAVYDATGGYAIPFTICAGAMAVSASLFVGLAVISRGGRRVAISA